MTDSKVRNYKTSGNNNADGKQGNYPSSAPDQITGLDSASRLGRLATSSTVRRQRRIWSRRVNSWDHHTPSGLEKVTAAVLAAVSPRPGDQVVDLGCGTGQLSLPLAERGARVLAVDVSAAMVGRLEANARERGHRQRRGPGHSDRESLAARRQRRPRRHQLRPAPPARRGQEPGRVGGLPVAAPGRHAARRRHDVRPGRHQPGPRHHQVEGQRAGQEGHRRLVADRQEQLPVPGAGAGAPGLDERVDDHVRPRRVHRGHGDVGRRRGRPGVGQRPADSSAGQRRPRGGRLRRRRSGPAALRAGRSRPGRRTGAAPRERRPCRPRPGSSP